MIEADRLVSGATESREEVAVDRAMRPRFLKDYVGKKTRLSSCKLRLRLRKNVVSHLIIF